MTKRVMGMPVRVSAEMPPDFFRIDAEDQSVFAAVVRVAIPPLTSPPADHQCDHHPDREPDRP